LPGAAGDHDPEDTAHSRDLARLRQDRIARYASDVRQNTSIRIRIHRAVETETPTPVKKAT
jgi:hypothetical protein